MQKHTTSLILLFIAISCMLFAIQSIYYQIDQNRCRICGRCTINCVPQAIQFNEQTGQLVINQDLCTGCGACVNDCPYGAIYSVTGNSDNTIPHTGIMLSNKPNPMHTYTDFSITNPNIKQPSVFAVYNSKGQSVCKKVIKQSTNNFRWNGTDSNGEKLPNGIYTACLICGKARTSTKITLVR